MEQQREGRGRVRTGRASTRVLLVEDDPDDRDWVREVIGEARQTSESAMKLELEWEDRLAAGAERLESESFDCVLLDLSLPDSRGLATLTRLHERAPGLPIVILSGAGDLDMALSAVEAGAQDYLVKGRVDADGLGRALRYAMERQRWMRQHEERLRELATAQAYFREMLATSPEGMIVVGESGDILFTNEPADALLGGSAAGGRIFLGPLRWPPRPGDANEIEVARGHETRIVEVRVLRTLWERRCAHLVVLRDITEHRRAWQRQRRLELRVQELQRLESLGLLAGGAAHDFNNLLQVVHGNARAAVSRLPDGADPQVVGCLERIDRATDHGRALTKQLMATAGRSHCAPEEVDLSQLAESMAALLQLSIPPAVRFEQELSTHLPSIEADVGQVRQVVLNLISNAVEALGDHGGTVWLRTGVADVTTEELQTGYDMRDATGGRFVFVEVQDTGCGMDPETRARVFDPFFTTKDSGSGLGLASVFGIAIGHEGAVRIDTTEERGTTVRVLFPAPNEPTKRLTTPAPPGDAKAGTPEEPVAPAVTDRFDGRALVADHDEGVREVTGWLLEQLGLDVTLVANGREAAERLEADDSFRVVVLDLHKSEVSGRDAFGLVRKCSSVPMVLTSGQGVDRATANIALDDRTTFVQKPYSLEEMRELLGRLLLDSEP